MGQLGKTLFWTVGGSALRNDSPTHMFTQHEDTCVIVPSSPKRTRIPTRSKRGASSSGSRLRVNLGFHGVSLRHLTIPNWINSRVRRKQHSQKMSANSRFILRAFVASFLLAAPAFAKRGMIVTAPKQMQAGATEKVFVTFHDIDFDVEMKLVLKEEHEPGEYGTWSFSFRAGQSQVIDFTIPDNVPVTVVVLRVEAASVDSARNYSFEADAKINRH
ncbi:hypothetical protein LSAT2_022984 [Lamellibrachia satsuma]|nr:hypothetical protein LSAT2_022984 [Lamellibrachia satsuma]